MSSKLVCLCLNVFVLLFGVISCEEDTSVFSNSWAVEVKGGLHIANQLAEKHGFINKGMVGISDYCETMEHCMFK